MRPRVPPQHKPIDARAKEYAVRTYHWLKANEHAAVAARLNAWEVISWFHSLIPAKVNRALTRWPDEDPEDSTSLSDSDGSAKVALDGIDRSHAAWLELADHGGVSRSEADSFIADLVWLGEALERVRPNARAFVRPAFDEPEAMAIFLAGEEGR